MTSTHDRLTARYRSGDVPWDDPLPPPEIIATVAGLPPGRALDLGTGYGRAARYLARAGWQVDAVDFVAEALAEAHRRAAADGVTVAWHHADVSRLDFLDGPFDLVIDVGCAHALDAEQLQRYHAHLRRLLRPGGRYVLFARTGVDSAESDSAEPTDAPRALDEARLLALFADGFTLTRAEHDVTQMATGAWASAWFWFVRDGDEGAGATSVA